MKAGIINKGDASNNKGDETEDTTAVTDVDTEQLLADKLQLWNDEKERLHELLEEYLPGYTRSYNNMEKQMPDESV